MNTTVDVAERNVEKIAKKATAARENQSHGLFMMKKSNDNKNKIIIKKYHKHKSGFLVAGNNKLSDQFICNIGNIVMNIHN
jgi:hypothetical protein